MILAISRRACANSGAISSACSSASRAATHRRGRADRTRAATRPPPRPSPERAPCRCARPRRRPPRCRSFSQGALFVAAPSGGELVVAHRIEQQHAGIVRRELQRPAEILARRGSRQRCECRPLPADAGRTQRQRLGEIRLHCKRRVHCADAALRQLRGSARSRGIARPRGAARRGGAARRRCGARGALRSALQASSACRQASSPA